MNRPTAKCPTCGEQFAPVEWRQFPYHAEWAYFFTIHSRPDNGWQCQGVGTEALLVRDDSVWNDLNETIPEIAPERSR